MAADSTGQSLWNTTEDVFVFDPTAPDHIPRAWERAPKSPVTSRHNGRKIWKRHDGPSKGLDTNLRGSVLGFGESRPVLGDATNTLRPVKRMRVKDAVNAGVEGKENMMARSFATLHEAVTGTPKRKQASRRDLDSDRPEVDVKQSEVERAGTPDNYEDNVRQDSLRASESPALSDVRELLISPDPTSHAVKPDLHLSYNEDVMGLEEDSALTAEATQEIEVAIGSEDNATICEGAAYDREDTVETDVHSENPALKYPRKSVDAMNYVEENVDADTYVSDELVEASEDYTNENVGVEQGVKFDKMLDNAAPNTVVPEPSSPVQYGTGNVSHTPAIEVPTEHCPVVTPKMALIPSLSPMRRCGDMVVSNPSHTFLPMVPDVLASTASANAPGTEARITELDPSLSSPSATPKLSNTLKLPQSLESLRVESPGQSPQIGTSLLKRESLRRKESPEKRGKARKIGSPKKRETLSRRDTLQEREILQKVISETKTDQSIEDLDNGVMTALAPELEALQDTAMKANSEDSENIETRDNSADGTGNILSTSNRQTGKDKDLDRPPEAIETHGSPKRTETSGSSAKVSANDIQATQTLEDDKEKIARINTVGAVQVLETDKNSLESSNRKTRSRARFSDDTSMLKDFLNRAQAKKAAKPPVSSVPDLSEAPKPQISPRRSPRKTLGSHDGNALSPRKQRDIANRLTTPPTKLRFVNPDSDEVDEISEEVTSCRRSTRTRLPAPSKALPGAPSFIPVRRADGADHVVLQKSQAQELAIVTRANTRRNKGQSKPPLLALQELPAEITENASILKQQVANSKTVGWAEKLASYQAAKDAEEAEVTQPQVRRMRGLGAAKGTPGPKRTTAVVSTSNGTPAPKRRGKV